MIERLVKKCEFCSEPATRITVMYSLDFEHLFFWTRFSRKLHRGAYTKHCVCSKHYFEFEHGLATIACDSCTKGTMLTDDDFYNMERVFCAHCGKMITEGLQELD